VIGPA